MGSSSSRSGRRTLNRAGGTLILVLIGIWILSLPRAFYVARFWDVAGSRRDPANPANMLVNHATGNWMLRSECGAIIFWWREDSPVSAGNNLSAPALTVHWAAGSSDISQVTHDTSAFLEPRFSLSQRVFVVPYLLPLLLLTTVVIVVKTRMRNRR